MSVPFEFWAIIDKGEVVAVTSIPSGGVHVRYLRADLTCGECAKRLKDCVKSGLDGPFPANGKACMAFAPKEKK